MRQFCNCHALFEATPVVTIVVGFETCFVAQNKSDRAKNTTAGGFSWAVGLQEDREVADLIMNAFVTVRRTHDQFIEANF